MGRRAGACGSLLELGDLSRDPNACMFRMCGFRIKAARHKHWYVSETERALGSDRWRPRVRMQDGMRTTGKVAPRSIRRGWPPTRAGGSQESSAHSIPLGATDGTAIFRMRSPHLAALESGSPTLLQHSEHRSGLSMRICTFRPSEIVARVETLRPD